MNDLIKITVNDGKQTVNARDLHTALEVGRDFSSWIKGRIEEYGFAEGEDYHLDSPNLGNQDVGWDENLIVPKTGDNQDPQHGESAGENLIVAKTGDNQVGHGGKREGAGRPEINYLLSVDMAKELAIVENNEAGRKIRRYLIRIEQEHVALLESTRRDHALLQNIHDQLENYRIKYINLLDNLEKDGMPINKISALAEVDRATWRKLRTP
jgi:phage anti-repressor protein